MANCAAKRQQLLAFFVAEANFTANTSGYSA